MSCAMSPAFHGLHVVAGLSMNGYLQALSWTKRLGAATDAMITNVAWYWHFVDAIWILVLLTVYLSPRYLGIGT